MAEEEAWHAEAFTAGTGPPTALAGCQRRWRPCRETVTGGRERVLRQTVIAMVTDAALDEHANLGRASVYVLRGRVLLTAVGQSWEGRDGDLVIVPDSPHSLRAQQDSAVLPGSRFRPMPTTLPDR